MTPTIQGYSIVFIPRSWAIGAWHRPHKSIYSFGPFRFVHHVSLGEWRAAEPLVTAETWDAMKQSVIDDSEAAPAADPDISKQGFDPAHGLDRPQPGWHARCLAAVESGELRDSVDSRGTKYAINPNGYAPSSI